MKNLQLEKTRRNLEPVFQNLADLKKQQQIDLLHQQLENHAIYDSLKNIEHLKIFMQSHIFAVWDFMSLLKTLQRNLTCIEHPWTPPSDQVSARLINEIVLAEESDHGLEKGSFLSHFSLYHQAMQDIGADTRVIDQFIHLIRKNHHPEPAIDSLSIPGVTKAFVKFSLSICAKPSHIVASVFLMGREEIIPTMFDGILNSTEPDKKLNTFRYYLERHSDLDANEHAPMGQQLLARLCENDPIKWNEATDYAIESLEWRLKLWNKIQVFFVD